MSLLVTSCTMGKQPDRLLDKGPQYLRTRTNRGLFAHHRKSAVELLAASKAQFYKVPSVSAHDQHELNLSADDTDVSYRSQPQEQLTRSKSEFDISTLRSLVEFDSLISAQGRDNSLEDEQESLEDEVDQCRSKECTAKLESENLFQIPRKSSVGDTISSNSVTSYLAFQLQSMPTPNSRRSGEYSISVVPKSLSDTRNQDRPTPKKPKPLPRKYRIDKPVPPPRKPHPKVPLRLNETKPHEPKEKLAIAKIDDSSFTSFPNIEAEENVNLATPKRKRSLVETLAQHFTSLCTDFPFSSPPSSKPPTKEIATPSTKDASEYSNKECSSDTLYQAKPIYIPQDKESCDTYFQAKPVYISPTNKCQNHLADDRDCSETCQNSSDTNNNVKGKKRYPELPIISSKYSSGKRYPELPMSNKHSTCSDKRERKTSEPESIPTSPLSRSDVQSFSSMSLSASHSNRGTELKMSIESVEPVVYDSEVNAIPSAITTSVDSLGCEHGEPHQVTRVNSSLSGKMEAQDASFLLTQLSAYPCSPLPRSHSDISCRLEGQHSRDSSLVSNKSRLSRASAGADLEKFFNQMGLERGILDPITRLRELQNSEVLASVSSLESHDASSIGSTFSASDHNGSESQSQSTERNQHPTSVVERNARIIKWLCNVRRAKSQSSNLDGAAATSSTVSTASGNA